MNDDTSSTEIWDDLSDMSLSCPPRSRRRSSGSIMKTATLDESLHSIGASSRRGSSCRMPVSFDLVEIREHPIILDESRNGPALTIDWNPFNTEITTVQEFDCTREIRKVRLLPLAERVAILMRAGYSKTNLCEHFAENVESTAAKKEAHPKKRVQQRQQQPATKPQNLDQALSQRSIYFKRVKKAAKRLTRQMSNSSVTLRQQFQLAPAEQPQQRPPSKVSVNC